jgi:hypothetical protein
MATPCADSCTGSDVLIFEFYGFHSIHRYIQCYSKRNEHPHSHISHHEIFSCEDVKDIVFVQPLSRGLVEMKERVVAAVSTIIGDMLQRVCDKMDYRTDVFRVTRGGEYWASVRLRKSCGSSFTSWFIPHVHTILSHLVIHFFVLYSS